MTLSTLIQKNGLQKLATLTVATNATLDQIRGESVAKVANVAVANPETQKAIFIDATDNQLIKSITERPGDVFLIDDGRYCSECVNLSARRCLAAWRGEIDTARHYRPIDDLPRRCEGYAPKANDPDQRTGKLRWPGIGKSRSATE